MLNAMIASTGGGGTCTTPSVASASVMLCANVKAVMVLNSGIAPRTRSRRPSTKRR